MSTPEVRIALDTGLSGTKVVYSIGKGRPKLMLMRPEVIQLPVESIQTQQASVGQIGFVDVEKDAWVSLKKSASSVYAIGSLAKQFRASTRLETLKYEEGVYKLLAVLGAIIQKEQLPNEVAIRLTVVLPYGEITNRRQFQENLQKSLKNFYFRGRQIKASLVAMMCSPEGGGAIWTQIESHGESWFREQEAVVVLMLGHRNTSSLVFSHGGVETRKSRTTDLGFVQLVDKVIERTSGQDRDGLSRSIFEIGGDISTKNAILRSLIKSREEKNIETEAKTLVEVIRVARKEYWLLLKDWLDSSIPNRVDQLIISGGAGHYLRSELADYLGWADPTWEIVDDGLELELNKFRDAAMQYRFADVWRLFKHTLFVSAPVAA